MNLSHGLRRLAGEMIVLSAAAQYATYQIDQFTRTVIKHIRRDYVRAGKPFGNGYAPMMRWWRLISDEKSHTAFAGVYRRASRRR